MKHVFCRTAVLYLTTALAISSLAGCGSSTDSTSYEIAESGQWSDGIYTAIADGRNGDFEVTVTIKGGVIISAEVGANEETEDKGGAAIETLLPEIVSEQTYDVDAVSGATVTSEALKDAVAQCLETASQEALKAEG